MIQCALNVAVQEVFIVFLTGLLCTQEVKIYSVTSLQTLNLSFFKTDFKQAQHEDHLLYFILKKINKPPFTGLLPSQAFWAAQEAAKPVNNNHKDVNSVLYINIYATEMKQQSNKPQCENLHVALKTLDTLRAADGCELENKLWIYRFWFLLFFN